MKLSWFVRFFGFLLFLELARTAEYKGNLFIDPSKQKYNVPSIEETEQKLERLLEIDRRDWELHLPMTVPQTIEDWGYPCEIHNVTTDDGYILEIHRLYNQNSDNKDRKVALLWHGVTGSSSNYAFGPPDKSLAYILYDHGFDVWLGNTRGNTYSKNHETLNTCSAYNETCSKFWDFGFDDGAAHDYPAVIDHILEETGQEQMYFVGHSMGTTQFLALLSDKPEYNDKFVAAALMAPAVYLGNGTNTLLNLSTVLVKIIEKQVHKILGYELVNHRKIESFLAHWLCTEGHKYHDKCIYLAQTFLDYNWDQLNETMIPQYLDHYPAGTSSKPLVHYVQLQHSEVFQKYDYGRRGNMEHYGSRDAPMYDLTKVTTPIALYVGDADSIVTIGEANRIAADLQNVIENRLIDYEGFQHQDFVLAMNAPEKVYKYILEEAFKVKYNGGK